MKTALTYYIYILGKKKKGKKKNEDLDEILGVMSRRWNISQLRSREALPDKLVCSGEIKSLMGRSF